LIESHIPLSYWGEALTSAAYLINRVPSSTINFQTPSQALTEAVVASTVPNLSPHIFGCVAFVHLHKHQRNKLSPRALRCVFLGYAAYQKGYRCYHPPTQRMFITLDVTFHEDSMYFSSEPELQGEYQKEIQTLDYDDHISEDVVVHIPEVGELSDVLNQEVGELDVGGLTLDPSSDEHPEIEVVAPPMSESLTPQEADTPNQSLAEDAPEPFRR